MIRQGFSKGAILNVPSTALSSIMFQELSAMTLHFPQYDPSQDAVDQTRSILFICMLLLFSQFNLKLIIASSSSL